jgi:NitT/TauT family transport system permease protein
MEVTAQALPEVSERAPGIRPRHWRPLALLGGILLVTELAVRVLDVPEFFFPRPSRIFAVFVMEFPYFWEHLRSTLTIMLAGSALAFLISFVLASLMAHSRALNRGLFPVLVILKLVPTIAVAPLIILWFGLGLQTQVAVVVLIVFFPMVVNLYTGLTEVDADMVTLMRSQGASTRQIFTKLRVPHSLGYIFTSLRAAVPLSSIGAIVGEWAGASEGIGFIVKFDAALFKTAHVFAALLTIGLAGIALFGVVVLLEALRVRD